MFNAVEVGGSEMKSLVIHEGECAEFEVSVETLEEALDSLEAGDATIIFRMDCRGAVWVLSV